MNIKIDRKNKIRLEGSFSAKLIGSLISSPLYALDQIKETHVNDVNNNVNKRLGA
jgi:hypothetical protein